MAPNIPESPDAEPADTEPADAESRAAESRGGAGSSHDPHTSVGELREMVRQFVGERDWEKYHAPKNISMALAVEAAELMECFQWVEVARSRGISEDPERFQAAREELADVVCYAFALCNELDIDLTSAMREKMVKNRKKYPVSVAKTTDFAMEKSGSESEQKPVSGKGTDSSDSSSEKS